MTQSARAVQDRDRLRIYVPVKQLLLAGSPTGYQHWFVPCPVGARADSYDRLRGFLEGLVVHCIRQLGCSHESFIALGRKADRSAGRLLGEHARRWSPQTGMGIWVHQPPPRMVTADDIEDLDPESGTQASPVVFRVQADEPARLHAMGTMLGTGSGLQLLSRMESTRMLRLSQEYHLGTIEDPVYRMHPWYAPLVEGSALSDPLSQRVLDSLQNITLYIRESPEDGGVVLLSTEPLSKVFALLGCTQISQGEKESWNLPGEHL